MADRVQRVIYRVIIDTSTLAADAARARAIIQALRDEENRQPTRNTTASRLSEDLNRARKELKALQDEDNRYTAQAVRNAEQIRNARKKIADAERDIAAQRSRAVSTGGDTDVPGAAGAGRTPSRGGVERNYHPQLNTIIVQLQRLNSTLDRFGRAGQLGGTAGGVARELPRAAESAGEERRRPAAAPARASDQTARPARMPRRPEERLPVPTPEQDRPKPPVPPRPPIEPIGSFQQLTIPGLKRADLHDASQRIFLQREALRTEAEDAENRIRANAAARAAAGRDDQSRPKPPRITQPGLFSVDEADPEGAAQRRERRAAARDRARVARAITEALTAAREAADLARAETRDDSQRDPFSGVRPDDLRDVPTSPEFRRQAVTDAEADRRERKRVEAERKAHQRRLDLAHREALAFERAEQRRAEAAERAAQRGAAAAERAAQRKAAAEEKAEQRAIAAAKKELEAQERATRKAAEAQERADRRAQAAEERAAEARARIRAQEERAVEAAARRRYESQQREIERARLAHLQAIADDQGQSLFGRRGVRAADFRPNLPTDDDGRTLPLAASPGRVSRDELRARNERRAAEERERRARRFLGDTTGGAETHQEQGDLLDVLREVEEETGRIAQTRRHHTAAVRDENRELSGQLNLLDELARVQRGFRRPDSDPWPTRTWTPGTDQDQMNRLTAAMDRVRAATNRATVAQRDHNRTRTYAAQQVAQQTAALNTSTQSVNTNTTSTNNNTQSQVNNQRAIARAAQAARTRAARIAQALRRRATPGAPGQPGPSPLSRAARGAVSGVQGLASGIGAVANALTASSLGRWRYWQVLLAAILAILVLLIPLVVSATAAIGALASAGVVAFAGLAVFALAAVGNVKKLTEAIKEAQRTGARLPAQYQAAGRAFDGLSDAYRKFQAETRQPVFGTLIDAMGIATRMLPRLVPIAAAVGAGIRQALGVLDDAFSSGGFDEFLALISRTAPGVIVSLTRSVASFSAGFAELFAAFEPYFDWVLTGLENMADGFRRWAASLETSDAFREFMDYAKREGPRVLETVGALVSLIIDLGKALAPAGEFGLFLIRVFAELLDAIPTDALQAVTIILTGWLALRGAVLILNLLAAGLALVGRAALAMRLNIAAAAVSMVGLSVGAHRARTGLTALQVTAAATRAAMIGLGLIAVGLLAVWSAMSESQARARRATEEHRDAVIGLAHELQASDGVATNQLRQEKLRGFATNKVEPRTGWLPWNRDKNLAFQKDSTTVLEESKIAGVDTGTLIEGAVGDDKARNDAIAKWQAFIAKLKEERDKAMPNSVRRNELTGQIAESQRALDAYKNQTASAKDLAEANADLDAATSRTADGMDAEAAAAERLRKTLDQLTETTKEQDRIQAAIDARQRYLDLVEQQSDAERDLGRLKEDVALNNERALLREERAELNLVEAQRRAKESQEAVNRARETAALKLEEYRDRLRDVALNEEQASISLARAEENLRRVMNDPGSSQLDRRQALLDLQRAKNDWTDQLEENQLTRIDAGRAIDKGVEGSDEVLQAIRDRDQATRDLRDAERELKDAQRDRIRTEQDGKEALEDAQREFGELATEVSKAREQVEKLTAAANLTPASLDAMIKKHQELRDQLAKELSTKGLDDFEARLKTLLKYQRATQLVASNPNMTIDQALKAAEKEFNAEARRRSEFERRTGEAYASGGPVRGRGTGTSDEIPAWLSAGEHVWTAAETVAIGGHRVVETLRGAAKAGKFTEKDVMSFFSGAAQTFATGGYQGKPLSGGQYFDPATGKWKWAPGARGIGHFEAAQLSKRYIPEIPTGGLTDTARGTYQPTISAGSVKQSYAGTSAGGGGMSIGQITINNPVVEPAGESLYRAVRKLTFEYES